MIGLFCCFFIFILFNFKLLHFTSSGELWVYYWTLFPDDETSLEINWIIIQKFYSVLNNSYGYTQIFLIVCEILVYEIILNCTFQIRHCLLFIDIWIILILSVIFLIVHKKIFTILFLCWPAKQKCLFLFKKTFSV